MSTEIEKQKTFEERMKARIRDSIGELMTDEELSKIVNKATEEVFFKPLELKDGYRTKEVPPFSHNIVKELLTDSVRKEVEKYFSENKEDVSKMVKQIIQDGLGKALMNALDSKFQFDLNSFGNNLLNTLQNQ